MAADVRIIRTYATARSPTGPEPRPTITWRPHGTTRHHTERPCRDAHDRRPGSVRPRGRDHHRGLSRKPDPDPQSLLSGRTLDLGRLPALRRRAGGTGPALRRLLDPCRRGHARSRPIPKNSSAIGAPSSNSCSPSAIMSARCASPMVTASCNGTPRNAASTMCSVPYRQVAYPVDSSHEMFRMDHNRCILCTRCVRVCDEIEGAHTKDVMGRGSDCRIITDLAAPWGDSDTCTSCGKCVQVCPTGALVKQGTSVGEMVKDQHFLPILARRRHAQ